MRSLILLMLLVLAGCATAKSQSEPADSSMRQRSQIHAELGGGYFVQNQLGIALDEFNEAVRLDPSYAPAHAGLGLVHAALRQDDKAEASFKRALQLDPESSESHNNYGTFLCARNRIDESIAEFMAAVSNPLYSTPESAYMNAGICALKKNDVAHAEDYLMQAVQIRPGLRQASYLLADINFSRAAYGESRKYLQRAMQAGEPTPEMLWLAVRLERLQGDKDAEASYSLLLRKKYPESAQTKAMLAE